MKTRDLIKSSLPLILVVGTAILVSFAFRWPQGPREFRGTFCYAVAHIGGEGGAAMLTTPDGGYDLFFSRGQTSRQALAALNGKRVVLLGHPRVVRGIERKRYRAIDVIAVSPE